MKYVNLRKPRGQELTEFALTLMILSLMVFGIIDLGRAVYYYSALQNAVREGARWGIIHQDDVAGVENIVRDRAIGLDPTELTMVQITYDYNDYANDYEERTLKVWFSYRFTLVTPVVGNMLGLPGNQVMLNASSTMYQEY